MPKYLKKPIVIEAFELGYNFPQDECNDWFLDAITTDTIRIVNMGKWYDPNIPSHIEIKTLEGTMRGDMGDFIIRGINGEIYPCKPDIFLATYESVE